MMAHSVHHCHQSCMSHHILNYTQDITEGSLTTPVQVMASSINVNSSPGLGLILGVHVG